MGRFSCKQQIIHNRLDDSVNCILHNVRHCGVEGRLFAGVGLVTCADIGGDGFQKIERKREFAALFHLSFGARVLDTLGTATHVTDALPT